jgi:hypothetical protein
MKCGKCNRRIPGQIYSYGGVIFCGACHEMVNPPVEVVTKLSDDYRQRLINQKSELEGKIRQIERTLRMDDKVRESGYNSLTFSSSPFLNYSNK